MRRGDFIVLMRLVFVVLVSMGMSATTSSAAVQRGFQRAPGEIVMNRACLDCHDLTPIRIQALDAEGWTDIVEAMVEKGAEVAADDVPVLTNYLMGRYGPVPEGPGKPILLNTCTVCHNRDRIFEHAGADREHWENTLLAMVNEGAFLTDSEFNTLLNYLVRTLGP